MIGQAFRRCHWLLRAQLGVDPGTAARSLRGFPRYVRDLVRFRSRYHGRLELVPCLHDWYEEGGNTRNEYFWQDLLVARMVFAANPNRHVDVGSRLDGFIAHVAAFREIEVFDVRSVTASIPGVTFRQADLMQSVIEMSGYCDSLSCLHALEHFGLGRYGDPLDPDGFSKGLANLASLLKAGGVLYLSVPIGRDRVEFNANRVFDPCRLVDLARGKSLALTSVNVVREGGSVEVHGTGDLSDLAKLRYALGIFTFKKN